MVTRETSTPEVHPKGSKLSVMQVNTPAAENATCMANTGHFGYTLRDTLV